MKQYEPCIQNNNNNNIIIIIIKWKKKKAKGGRDSERGRREGEHWRERIYIYIYIYIYIFSSIHFFFRFTKIGSLVFVGTEGKVDLRDESYAWTPKSWSFIKLHEVGNFPTCVISSLKAI